MAQRTGLTRLLDVLGAELGTAQMQEEQRWPIASPVAPDA